MVRNRSSRSTMAGMVWTRLCMSFPFGEMLIIRSKYFRGIMWLKTSIFTAPLLAFIYLYPRLILAHLRCQEKFLPRSMRSEFLVDSENFPGYNSRNLNESFSDVARKEKSWIGIKGPGIGC